MIPVDRAALCRVRLLVLREIHAAGGRPAAWQVARALEPVVGTLQTAAVIAGGHGAPPDERPAGRCDRSGQPYTGPMLPDSPSGSEVPPTVESGSRPGEQNPPF